VADTGNNTIRKVTPAGGVTTVAGTAGMPDGGTNDGTGLAAQFYHPCAVAVDTAGYLYVADADNYTIRMITPASVVSTLAGNPGVSGFSDKESDLPAQFSRLSGIVVNNAGNLYVSDTDNYAIRAVDPAGYAPLFAGSIESGPDMGWPVAGNSDGNGTDASFNQPYSLALDAAGNIYVADKGNGLRRISINADVTTSVNSTNIIGIQAVAVDSTGNVFLADTDNHVIRRGVLTGGGLIIVKANTASGGSVSGSGLFPTGSNVQLTATASNGWALANWTDGNTNSTRTITVSTSTTYTANFGQQSFVTALANPTNGGSVAGGGAYFVGSNAVLTATASNNWLFANWNDGSAVSEDRHGASDEHHLHGELHGGGNDHGRGQH
ncbi:MAG: hypothetical protein NTY53_23765, partial [Kiritimatiellaeota bacterium]|nr:hypothetical protein [Kiritimatiellota bacterium]